jgi:hypothetical protein
MALSKIDVANMLTGLVPNDNTIRRPNAKPIIINGDMAIAQRGTSATGKTSSGYYTCDRIQFVANDAGTHTVIQETSTSGNAYINGFAEAYRIDCTTADASVAADSALFIKYKVEGRDAQVFKKGTSNAEKFTLAFWVKSNKTGTGQVNLRDEVNTRQCSATYTISSANTWEHKICNFAADTTGALPSTNAEGFGIEWYLAAGSNYTSGTAPTAWEAISNADSAASLNLAISGSTDNDFSLTGVQLEVGEYSSTTLPPFQFESFEDSLTRCHRYFLYTGGGSAYQHHGSGVEVSSTAAYMTTPLSCPFRASPSITANNTSGGIVIYDGNTESAVTSVGTTNYSPNTSLVNVAVNASGGGIDDGNGITVYSNANSNAGFLFDAEL